jgi:hypothetical protein
MARLYFVRWLAASGTEMIVCDCSTGRLPACPPYVEDVCTQHARPGDPAGALPGNVHYSAYVCTIYSQPTVQYSAYMPWPPCMHCRSEHCRPTGTRLDVWFWAGAVAFLRSLRLRARFFTISNLDIGPPTPSPVGRVGRQLRQPKEVSSLLLDFLVHSYSRVRFLFRSGPGRCFDLLSF